MGYKAGLNANKRPVVGSVMVQTPDTKDLTCNEKEAKKSDHMPENRKVKNWKANKYEKTNCTTN